MQKKIKPSDKVWVIIPRMISHDMKCLNCEGKGYLYTVSGAERFCDDCKGSKKVKKRLQRYIVDEVSVEQVLWVDTLDRFGKIVRKCTIICTVECDKQECFLEHFDITKRYFHNKEEAEKLAKENSDV